MRKKNELQCAFCGRPQEEVGMLIAGQNVHICNHCIDGAKEIIDQELNGKFNTFDLPANVRPVDIKAFLDMYVIGQDDAKKVLSVGVDPHRPQSPRPQARRHPGNLREVCR